MGERLEPNGWVPTLNRSGFLGQLDFLNGTDLGKVAIAEKQLRSAVSPMDAQGEMFFDVLHCGLKKPGNPGWS